MRLLTLATRGLVLVALACRPQPEPATSSDGRTPLAVPVEAADAVRAEMRTMLGSLNAILKAVSLRDTATMRQAAIASGTAAAADTALEHLLPEAFVMMGMSAHQQFDSLGAAVGAGLGADSVVARLGRLTESCVSCHATYRLAVTPGTAP